MGAGPGAGDAGHCQKLVRAGNRLSPEPAEGTQPHRPVWEPRDNNLCCFLSRSAYSHLSPRPEETDMTHQRRGWLCSVGREQTVIFSEGRRPPRGCVSNPLGLALRGDCESQSREGRGCQGGSRGWFPGPGSPWLKVARGEQAHASRGALL